MSELSERAILLEQLAGYLAWEEELGGAFVPSTAQARQTARAAAPAQRRDPEAPVPALPNEQRTQRDPEAPVPALPNEQRPLGVVPAPVPAPAAPSPAASAALSSEERRHRLALLDQEVRSCTRCELHAARTHTVFARGNPDARLVFVGEGPGQEEDRTGQPFVGPAGQLLDKMVVAMGLAREEVYICNVVKCRPPGNRTPLPSEAGACASFLEGQLEAIRPRVIVALGRCAAENMGLGGSGWRGRWGRYQNYDVMPTYHPAFLLRSPEFKRPVWEDLQRVMAKLKGNA